MAWSPLMEQLYYVDERFHKRWPSAKPIYDDVRLQILLYAGRQAAASFSIVVACAGMTTMQSGGYSMVEVAEQGMLYEPSTYWHWHGYDADGKPLEGRHLHEGGRKKRLIWERERAFWANGEKHGDLTPRERWEGFKSFVERKRESGRFVKRIAVANWMTRGDMEWIAKTLTRLEALDLSDVPPSYSACSVEKDATWLGYLRVSKARKPVYRDNLEEMFPSYKGMRGVHQEENRLADLYEHRYDYGYKTEGPSSSVRQHELGKEVIIKKTENFEDWFWRLRDQDEGWLPGSDSGDVSTNIPHKIQDKPHPLQEEIAETHLWRRLKWLGLPDWRSNSYAAKMVGTTIPPWCVSMKTVSIRGDYTRDRSSNEFASIHNHVCRLILGIERIVPASVTKLELRLSVSFLRYFLEQLEKRKSSIKRVGIDLGAWVQVFPLGNPPEHLKDADIRETTRRLARNVPTLKIFHPKKIYYRGVQEKEDAYAAEHEYAAKQTNFYRNRSGNFEPYQPIKQAPQPQSQVESTPADYGFFEDVIYDSIEQHDACPLDRSNGHRSTKEEVDHTRANTLAKLLEKLHLARHKVGDERNLANVSFRNNKPAHKITREGAQLFGLPGEAQTRSFDPIDPLTLTQQEVKTDLRAGADYNFWNPEALKAVYPWIAETFAWRPVFDWDWFMVPQNMGVTENANIVTINSSGKRGSSRLADWQLEGKQSDGRGKPGKALENALGFIKKQFALLNEANIPVHLLIGRRDPDMSSCYWGWPYTKQAWKEWNEQFFSANLETIAEHVDTLSIMYDLRNPIDNDRLASIDVKRPYHPPHGKCPTRVCLLEKHNNGKCPFVEKYPGQRNKHPRPQVTFPKVGGKLQKKKIALPTCSGLADNGSSGPPAGELADDEAKEDDSDDDEVFPLRLARRSVYLRETVGWIRFWEAYGTSFTKLTALHVRMPRCHDNISSWRLARLLNRHNGWHFLTYPDERQHVQTEEDLLTSFDSENPTAPGKQVWRHLKEPRVWPAGRFVRRSWVWEPLKLVDERCVDVLPEDEDFNDADPAPVGKRYLAYRFAPRQKMELESHDNTIELGEIEVLREARRVVEVAVADEEANGDPGDENGLPIKPGGERILRLDRLPHEIPGFGDKLRSVHGHHVRNVAGSQWREELRAMLDFVNSEISKRREVPGVSGGELSNGEKWFDERDRLKELLAEEPPYSHIFEAREDRIALRAVSQKQWDAEDDDTAQPTTDDQTEPETRDPDYTAPLLPGETVPGDSEDTEADSLFFDSEPEDPTALPSSPPTSTPPRRVSSADYPPFSPPHVVQKPPITGPFDQSSSSSSAEDGDDEKKGGAPPPPPPLITIPKRLLENPEEGVVRSPHTPIDEDYTDDDDVDEGKGGMTGGEGVYMSAEGLGVEGGLLEAVTARQNDFVQMMLERENIEAKEKVEEEKVEEEKVEEEKVEEMKKSEGEAIPDPGGSVEQGGKAATSSKRKISETADVPNKRPRVSDSKMETPPDPRPDTKRKRADPSPGTEVPNKKPKLSAVEDNSDLSSKPEAQPAPEPAPKLESKPKPEPVPKPVSPPPKKRKQPPTTPAPPPVKKIKTTKLERVVKPVVEPPSDEGVTSDDAATQQDEKVDRTHSKTDYLPSPTKSDDVDSDSKDEEKVRKKTVKKTGKFIPLAPRVSPAPTITAPVVLPTSTAPAPTTAINTQVPTRANGDPDYARLTVVNLRALAKLRTLKLTGATRKADIIKRFEDDDARRRGR